MHYCGDGGNELSISMIAAVNVCQCSLRALLEMCE